MAWLTDAPEAQQGNDSQVRRLLQEGAKDDVGPDCLRVDGKTGPRIIPETPEVREMLNNLGDTAHIWVSGKGPVSRSSVQMAIRRIFQRAGLRGPQMGPHILWHTFATIYISSGGSLPHL